jgi:ribosomal protein L24
MAIATTDRPVRLAEMGRQEAEQITQTIKDNFDSLGAMLAQARDRKAYKALGYRSFESYCQSEFGKSISTAYQLIEDAKVISELEAIISKKYGEEVTLNFPSSHLKPLKAIVDTDEKLRAIEYAQKLAKAENRKATKKDLEIAVFHVSGKRSEDFRGAIQGLGFNRGVQVEVSKSLNQERGFVTRIDKDGKIYIEFHYGGNAAIPYDAADLRILSEDEQPAKPLTDDTTNKGDRVLIFSPALKGKEGTIFQWKPGKQALVTVDGQNSPVDVAYAEMELLKPEKKDSHWETDLSWTTAKQTYYYFQKEDKIYSDKWPVGLTLTPSSHELSPIEFMEHWENKISPLVVESLITPHQLKTLVIAQAIELSVNEGREFATDLIDCLQQFLPQNDTAKTTTLQQENQLLREQLGEAEAAIQAIVSVASTASPLASPEIPEFSV